MDNQTAIEAIKGQISILNSQISANQQALDALNVALDVLQNGYTSDKEAISTAVANALNAAKTAVDAAFTPVN